MRYFIVTGDCESVDGYYMEKGWLYTHNPTTMTETKKTIQLHNELLFGNDDHKSAPKDALLEITKDDYDLLMRIDELGYDNADMQLQIIESRRSDEIDE